MKLICTPENLKKAIYNSERMVSKQNTLPILNNILFEAEKGGLKLSATNLEIGVQVKIGAKVDKEGKITIPARLISNFSTSLPQGDNVELELVDQSLKIKSGHIKAVIKGISATDFPLIPKKSTEYLLEIPASELKNVLGRVIVSVAHNEARQELSGINVNFTKNEIYFASTDSFRLTECKLKISEKNNINTQSYDNFLEKRGSVIIPANTLIELNRVISDEINQVVKIAIEEGQIFFEFEGTRIVSRLINGKYPEYKHIMPENFKTTVLGEKSQLQNAIKVASIFTSGKSNDITLKINSEEKKVLVGARSVEVGENSTELNFEVLGDSQEIIFNAKYLLDGINMVSTPEVALLCNSEATPVAVKEVNEKTKEVLKEYTYIVMPIKN